MIERYNCHEITDLWTDYHRFKTYLQVELALLKALEGKLIPDDITNLIKDRSRINVERIKEIEQEVQHDVVAFCTSITENLPPDISKYFHYGCTSSDIIDTAISIMIGQSLDLILNKLKNVLELLRDKANQTQYIICMGRTHGRYAEPMSFGQKFLSFYAEFYRRFDDIKKFRETELCGQFSGPVGNFTLLSAEIELEALKSLGLTPEPISTQVIPRDRYAKLVYLNGLLAGAIERLATELRLLQHSDVNEAFEGFSKKQKGSSAMPHKKNPITSENLTGIARILKSHILISSENMILWHERDISHSSAERIYLPDNLGLVFYSLKKLSDLLTHLVIDKINIERKVFKQFDYLSGFFLHKIINSVDLSRDEVYEDIQSAVFDSDTAKEFINKLLSNKKYSHLANEDYFHLTDDKIRDIYLADSQKIFDRVYKQYPI